MASQSEDRSSAAFHDRPSRSPARGWFRGRVVIFLALLTSGTAGVSIGRYAFWTDPKSTADAPWAWRLPVLPEGISPEYRRLCEEAGTAVARVLEAFPSDPHSASALGITCYLAHDKRGEVACWERCLELDPGNAFAYSRLFALAEEEADYQRVADLARQAEVRDPKNIGHRGKLGAALMYLQRTAEAEQVLERHVRSGRADANDYLVLGQVCYQQGEFRKAKRVFEAASALAPHESSMVFNLANTCEKLGDTAQAEAHRARFQQLKAVETAAQKGDRSARDRVRDEVHIPVRVSEILRHVGKTYGDHGEWAWAEASWRRAVELNPADAETRQLLSNLCTNEGRLDESLSWIRELQQVDPQDHTHRRQEGIVLTRLRRYEEAEQVLRDLCQRDPLESSGYSALAELLIRRGGPLAEVQSLARRAVELDPSGTNLYLLANVAGSSGDFATARRAIAQALALEPGNEQYRRLSATIPSP